MKLVAALAFIAVTPGRRLLMAASSNAQPRRTTLPRARLRKAATSGRDENRPDRGS
jgi:hypothetical protein